MKVIADLKKIACLNGKVSQLVKKVEENPLLEVGCAIDIQDSYLVAGVKEKNGHLYKGKNKLDNFGLVDDLYYCNQRQGCCEDSFYGTLYFATDVRGEYVAVPFDD